MTRGETPEELGHVGRRSLIGDDRIQRQETGRRAQVCGLEQHGEVRFGGVQPVELQCSDAGMTTRLLAGRVELEPALGRSRRFALLLVVVGDLGGLLGDPLVVGTFGRATVVVGGERVGLPLERGVALCLQLRNGVAAGSGSAGRSVPMAAQPLSAAARMQQAMRVISGISGTIAEASRGRPGALVLPGSSTRIPAFPRPAP